MNMTQGTAALCEIELENGRSCGVTAIGRCATCGRAFCLTHQARKWDYYYDSPVPYVDMCVPCFAKSPEGVARAKAEQHKKHMQQIHQENSEAKNYFESGAARTDLLTAKIQLIEIYQVVQQWESTRRGLFRRYHVDAVKKVTFRGRGWILGEFKWNISIKIVNYVAEFPEEEGINNDSWLTALLDVSPDEFSSYSYDGYYSWNSTLVRVRPCSGGYEHSSLGYEWPKPYDPNHDRFKSDWREVAQAVRRLTGASS